MSVPTFIVAALFTIMGIVLASFYFHAASGIRGAEAEFGKATTLYNEVLSAWYGYAQSLGLDNAHPIRIEIGAEKTFLGILVTDVVLVVKEGYKEKGYRFRRIPAEDLRVNGTCGTFEEVPDTVTE